MGVAWARVGILALVLAVAVPAVTVFAQKGGEEGPIPERDTTCWPCHVAWAPPLKTFYNVLPPVEAGAAVGEPFDFVVQLQNVWTPAGDGPYILYYEPALDLTHAPSLGFFSDTPPLNETKEGTLPAPDPANPTMPVSGFVTTVIPDGATTLTLVLTPDDPNTLTGPKLVLNVYPGVTQPTGAPTYTVESTGRGASVTLELLSAEDFRGAGYGNWTIEAQWTPVQNPDPNDLSTLVGIPAAQAQGFTVDIHAAVEDTGERIQVQPTRARVPKGGSALFDYQLRANGPAAAGEYARLVVNATVYYKHNAGSSPDDYANITKAYAADIPLTFEGTRAVLRTQFDSSTVVGGGIQNGATMDTASEAVGYGSAFLLISSVWTGGMFGKASRRQLNGVFGTAKRRVAFHNFLSYGILLFASVHTVLFIIETAYYWTLGLIWGGLALLSLLLLGVTGAFQVQMIRRWNYATWRWSHYGLAVLAIVFTLVHMGLDGVNFGFVQERLGWDDPLDPRGLT
ncbi:MAG: ferric reductase-like transmembrane domain-containing protein [Candidatus Thermoplasmatota archaeon]